MFHVWVSDHKSVYYRCGQHDCVCFMFRSLITRVFIAGVDSTIVCVSCLGL